MKKVFVTNDNIKNYLFEILRQLHATSFKPDVVVGLVRGGCVPANFVSQFYDISCFMINKDTKQLDFTQYNNVLVIDDINDTGKALTETDFMLLGHRNNIKYAALISNEGSSFNVDYCGKLINKIQDPCWIVFPWENWWQLVPEEVYC